MQQLDMFDITLEGKIYRMEKWIGRLNRELGFLKKVYEMNEQIKRQKTVNMSHKPKQMEMFG